MVAFQAQLLPGGPAGQVLTAWFPCLWRIKIIVYVTLIKGRVPLPYKIILIPGFPCLWRGVFHYIFDFNALMWKPIALF